MEHLLEIAGTGLAAVLLHRLRSLVCVAALVAVLLPYLAIQAVAQGLLGAEMSSYAAAPLAEAMARVWGAGGRQLVLAGPGLRVVQLGVDPLHFGVVLVIAMGIGLFAPPLGLGLYGACLIGNVPIEQTIKPIMGYLGLLLLCLLVIAFAPALSTALPRAFGY